MPMRASRTNVEQPPALGKPPLPPRYCAVADLHPVHLMIATDVRPVQQEAAMNRAVPKTHPAVILRSHYKHLRALLAIAMVAVVGLSAAVVMLATGEDRSTGVNAAAPLSAPGPAGTRYDGGPEEGTRGTLTAPPPRAHATTAAPRKAAGAPTTSAPREQRAVPPPTRGW